MGKAGKRKGYRPRTQKQQAADAARMQATRANEERRKKTTRIFLIAICVLLALSALFLTAGLLRRCTNDTALRTRYAKIDRGMYTYYFYEYYLAELAEDEAFYTERGLDKARPLAEQVYGDGTWEDYFAAEVKAALRRMLVFADRAYAENVTDRYRTQCEKTAEDAVSILREGATEAGQSFAVYLDSRYGGGVNEETVRRAAYLSALGEAYYTDFSKKTYTEEERMALYEKDPAAYHTADVIAYEIAVDITNLTGEAAIRDAFTAAEQRANAIGAATDKETFLTLMEADIRAQNPAFTEKQIAAAADRAYRYHIPYAAADPVGTWVHADGRAAGDVAVLGATGDYTVTLCLTPPGKAEESRADAKYYLFPYSSYLTEALAHEAAENAYDAYLAGKRTEASFLALQETHGELLSCTGVTYGDIERPIAMWLSDPAREAGEVAIVRGHAGYYLLRFEGHASLPYWQELLADRLQEDEYLTFLSSSDLTVYDSVCRVPAATPAG